MFQFVTTTARTRKPAIDPMRSLDSNCNGQTKQGDSYCYSSARLEIGKIEHDDQGYKELVE